MIDFVLGGLLLKEGAAEVSSEVSTLSSLATEDFERVGRDCSEIKCDIVGR